MNRHGSQSLEVTATQNAKPEDLAEEVLADILSEVATQEAALVAFEEICYSAQTANILLEMGQ